MHLFDALSAIIKGDGNCNVEVFTLGTAPISGTQGSLGYDQLVEFWAQFSPYEMNTMIVSPATMVKFLKMEEFQNPLTGLNFQGTGKFTSPMGAELLRADVLDDETIIALDRRYALEMVQAGDICVEYDKIIDRQLECAAITSICGFGILDQQAAKVLCI